MSHTVEIKTEVRDPTAVASACRRLQLPPPVAGLTRLFAESVTGLAVQLPGWQFPVVCQTHSGGIKYDNYQGRWGDARELDKFLQAYAVEKALLEARKQGHSVHEQALADGSIKLTIQVAGATA
jgi:hypothetical protein